MNKNIEQLLTVAVNAHEKFITSHSDLSTTVGLLEQSLQGSNAITIDNIKLGQRLMLVILDAHPDTVGVGGGKKGTEDFTFIAQHPLEAMSEALIIELLNQNILDVCIQHEPLRG